jgi:hypothetical protein
MARAEKLVGVLVIHESQNPRTNNDSLLMAMVFLSRADLPGAVFLFS